MDALAALKVREVMVPHAITAAPETSVQEAAVLMGKKNVGCLLVLGNGHLEGILSERDLVRKTPDVHSWLGLRVGDVMTPDPLTVEPDENVARAVEMMQQKQVRHLPVVENGELLGVFSMRDLMQFRVHYLEALVRRQTADLEAKHAALEQRDRFMQYHLDMAGEIQKKMLPAPRCDFPPFSLAVAYYPLERVSGDFYDFTIQSADRLGVLIADVTGHGAAAALVSVAARVVFYAYGRTIESPAAVLRSMNDHLRNLLEAEHFVTMFYGVVDRNAMQLTYALAGHPTPLWYRRKNGAVESLDAAGTMIGILPEPKFEERTVTLAPGDVVLMYTDGVSECRSEQNELFGRKRIEAFLQSQEADSAEDLVRKLGEQVRQFRGKRPLGDDLTCIALCAESH